MQELNPNARPDFETLVEALRWRAQHQGDQLAYTFLVDGESVEQRLTYAGLDHAARAVAAQLQQMARHHKMAAAGDRVLLLYPPGLEYVIGFWGCLYAGVMAVPAYPPLPQRSTSLAPPTLQTNRIQAIVTDAQAALALTTSQIKKQLDALPVLADLHWLDTTALPPAPSWQNVSITAGDIAYLQYTSGSTAVPKGVMVTHANLIYNLSTIHTAFALGPHTVSVCWLPPFHDMGLIDGILGPVYGGFPAVLMSPAAFLQQPIRWLRAISRYRGSHSGGPNFAFDLCVSKTTPAQRASLDLSCWETAYNGAEPVRHDTLARFAQAFRQTGFQSRFAYPCYGLAEATLMVSGGLVSAEPVYLTVSEPALAQHQVQLAAPDQPASRTLTGSGRVWLDTRVRIVHPDSGAPYAPDETGTTPVGEIWIAGPTVARGYWQRPQETAHTFQAYTTDGDGPFLRSGDLGFWHQGELFVTGRLKDLIIIRGRNHYPQDIERTVEQSHAAVRAGCVAAFAIETSATEQLVVVAELRQETDQADFSAIIATIRASITREHDIAPYAIALIHPTTIPKTTSGKIQRHASRAAFLNKTLATLAVWQEDEQATPPPQPFSPLHVTGWLVQRLAQQLKIDAQQILVDRPLAEYGLDSVAAVGLAGELENWLGRKLPPTLLYEYPTIKALAEYLADSSKQATDKGKQAAATGQQARAVAIVGVGCRFPEAAGPEAFWDLLVNGVDAISEAPASRWDMDAFYNPEPQPGKMNTRWGGFLQNIDEFDAHFFGISPREAERMDPQQRLLLEVAWEALEDAGIPPNQLSGTPTGVFIGISGMEYGQMQLNDARLSDPYIGTGSALSIAANRLSYFLNLHGPSLAVDTACSSSLVALHLATQSVQRGESTLALVGGVNLILLPTVTVNFSQACFMAPDGRCKPFDARANGYVRSEGVGVIVLKPLAQAQADGDTIYAVIAGSAINQDGRSNGLTAPNHHAQEAVLRAAYANAGIPPHQVQYVETHGTGTALGDPIEAAALSAVLSPHRPASQPCRIGSVKSNLGHLEAAAGIASVIKVLLSLHHGQLPPTLHYQTPNPAIPFTDLGLQVQDTLTPWPFADERVASVSAFGFGGTNAHVVLRAPIQAAATAGTKEPDSTPVLLPLSAREPAALAALAQRYAALLSQPETNLNHIAYSASRSRAHHNYRLALVGSNAADMATHLSAYATNSQVPVAPPMFQGEKHPNRPLKLIFVCGGQGSQWWGMGQQLLAAEPVFRAVIAECDQLLRPYAEWSLLAELTRPLAESRLEETAITQPALFALQMGLAALWQKWGIQPDAVVGHSMGEVAAACISGALSLADGVRVIFHRGRLTQTAAGQGKMLVAEMTETEARAALRGYEGEVEVAAVNPASVVLAGESAAVARFAASLQARGVYCDYLRVDYASHSPQMTPLQPEIVASLQGIQPRSPTIPIYSTVTGKQVTGAALGPDYWSANLRQPVQFAAAMQHILADGYTAFLELNPHPVLSPSILQSLQQHGQAGLALSSLRRHQDEVEQMRQTLAVLYTQGWDVNWTAVYAAGQRVPLPRYPWQRQRYWLPTLPPWRAASDDVPTLPTASIAAVSDWLHELLWQPIAAPTNQNGSEPHRHWLIVSQESSISQRLAQRLRQASNAPRLLAAPPAAAAGWREIAAQLPAGSNILYLWDLESDALPDLTPLLRLAQALARRRQPAQLWLVTRGAQPAANTPVTPGQAVLWGMGRALALEYPDLWGGLIDLDPAQPPQEVDDLLACLTCSGAERQIACRAGQFFAPRLAAVTAPLPGGLRFRADATYLLTGGLGGLGLSLARWLVENGARRLALMGRTPLPPRAQWDQAATANRQLAARIAAIRQLEAAGATVVLLPADVADLSSLQAAFDRLAALQAEGLLPPLRGIFHLAGVAQPLPLLEITPEAWQATLRPKVAGTLNLHALAKETIADLDYFVLFSSMAAVLGSKDLAHYAAANAFMDGFAHYRRQLGLPALSINWGAWADAGMTVDTDQETYLRRLGVRPMPPAAALRRLGQAMTSQATQQMIADVDWATFRAVYEMGGPQPILANMAHQPAPPPAVHTAPAVPIQEQLQAAPTAHWPDLLAAYLQQQVGYVLRMPAAHISLTHSILELGLDSIMVMELIRQFQTDLGLGLFMREIFDRPSLADLAAYLARQLQHNGQPTATTPVPIKAVQILAPPAASAQALANRQTAPDKTHPTSRVRPLPAAKNPGMVFLLSAPRSGSTLLRAMLAGHPDLFCPPELHLLPYTAMTERQTALAGSYLDEGLQRAVMTLYHLDAAAAKQQIATWLAADRCIQEVYAELQQAAAPRLLLDKSPSYALHRAALDRAEAWFTNPSYIHLVRHPYAVIESAMRTRLDRLLGDVVVDREKLAEDIWLTANQNTRDFLQDIPADRKLVVLYEDLVRQPETTLRRICAFLNLPFHAAVLQPYNGDRMTDGIYAHSAQIGDPHFHHHQEIDAALADAWRAVRLSHPLNPQTRQLAASFHYDLPGDIELTSLTPLQPKGDKPPLFLVPPNGSTILTFTELARRLGPDQPVYGLEPLGLDGRHPPQNRVEEMAAHYIRELQTVQPHGPYLLGGRCFGGIVAFEMAQQLQRQGEHVALLAVLDVLVPPHTTLQVYRSGDNDADGVSKGRRLLYRGMYLLRQGPLKQLMWLRRLRQMRLEEGILPNVFGPQARYIREASDAHFQARLNYEPQVYPGRITLFANSEHTGGRQLNWAELTTAGVDIHIIPGNHLTMLQPPHLQTLVEKLRHVRDKALADGKYEVGGRRYEGGEDRRNKAVVEASPADQRAGEAEPRLVSPDGNRLERQLAAIWQRVLGREVGVQERLEGLTDNYLQAVYLCTLVGEQLGVQIPLPALALAPTIAELARLLSEGQSLPAWCVMTRLPAAGNMPSSRLPFFCVPDDAGTILSLLPLARHLGADQPVYGLQPLGLEPGQEPHQTIEEMAACYLQAIRAAQPHGPYRLGGHALGGIVAFEIAQQLAAQGEEIAHLAVIDTLIPPNATHHVWDPPRALENKAAETGNRLDRVIARAAYLVQRRRLRQAVPPPPGRSAALAAAEKRMRHLRQVAFAARFRYQPQIYAGQITLYANAAHTGRHQVKWAALTDAGIQIEIIPGTHDTLFRAAHISALAAPLHRHLQESG
ncbi:MAG: hypothetical protein Fur0021_17200 [Candidatus Promineifilaceae bacterium]